MNVPMPPTDNLYKFLAVTGCILFVSGNVGHALATRQYLVGMKAVNDHYTSEMLRAADGVKAVGDVDTAKTKFIAASARDWAEFNESHARRVLEIAQRDATYVTSIGAALMFVGFLTWYFLIQRHLDQQTRLEVAAARAALGMQVTRQGGPAFTTTT